MYALRFSQILDFIICEMDEIMKVFMSYEIY